MQYVPYALHGTVAPILNSVKQYEHMEKMIFIGLTEVVAKQWLEYGTDGVQQLLDRMVAEIERDKARITPEI